MNIRKSRWTYWWAYVFIGVLAIMTMWLNDRASDTAAWIFGIITIIILLIFEMQIRSTVIVAKNGELIIKKGFLTKKIRKINKKESEIEVKQTAMQQLLQSGSILIKTEQTEILTGMHDPVRLKKWME